MRVLTNTSYRRKAFLNTILSRELETCAFSINACYESVSNKQIMSIRVSDNRTICLNININSSEEKIFFGCTNSLEMSLAFRAYFVVNYIRCLETAKSAEPSSFFSGLVILESVGSLLSDKKTVSCVPDIRGENKNLRPIDVYCAIRAMTRVMLTYKSSLSDEAERACETYINTLVAYTGIPETEYRGSKYAEYTVLCETEMLKSFVSKYPDITNEYMLFCRVGFSPSDNYSIDELLSACDNSKDKFWPGMIFRILAITQNTEALKKYLEHPSLKSSCQEFCINSMEYYYESQEQSLLLSNNWQAVQQIIKVTNQLEIIDEYHRSGMVHFIQ